MLSPWNHLKVNSHFAFEIDQQVSQKLMCLNSTTSIFRMHNFLNGYFLPNNLILTITFGPTRNINFYSLFFKHSAPTTIVPSWCPAPSGSIRNFRKMKNWCSFGIVIVHLSSVFRAKRFWKQVWVNFTTWLLKWLWKKNEENLQNFE